MFRARRSPLACRNHLEPAQIVDHFGVDAGKLGNAASPAPAGHARNLPQARVRILAHQWPTRIAQTGVNAEIGTGAEHVISQCVALVSLFALVDRNDFQVARFQLINTGIPARAAEVGYFDEVGQELVKNAQWIKHFINERLLG